MYRLDIRNLSSVAKQLWSTTAAAIGCWIESHYIGRQNRAVNRCGSCARLESYATEQVANAVLLLCF